MIKILFLGSRPASLRCFDFLRQHRDTVKIQGVVLNESGGEVDSAFEDRALENGFRILPLAETGRLDFDLGISVLFDKKISGDLVVKPRFGFLNFHLGPLPRLRGSNSILHAIRLARAENNWTFGVTLHFMDEKLDTGPVVELLEFPIQQTDTAGTLHAKACEQIVILFFRRIGEIIKSGKRLASRPQQGDSSFFRKNEVDHKVDLSWSPEKIYDTVRALTFPGKSKPYIQIGDYRYYLEADLSLPSKGAENGVRDEL